jgi:hypothetical protein
MGSDVVCHRASDFHFNVSGVPVQVSSKWAFLKLLGCCHRDVSGFDSRFDHRNFSSIFHHFWRPLSGESTFHYHQSWWLTCLIQLYHEMPVCECDCVNECDFRLKVVCCWGTLAWYGRGEEEGVCPPSLNHTCLSLEISVSVKTGRGCIGSSGNVRVGRLAIGLLWWNMGKLVFLGEWRLYVKSLQLPIWSSFKASCLGYPNHIHT